MNRFSILSDLSTDYQNDTIYPVNHIEPIAVNTNTDSSDNKLVVNLSDTVLNSNELNIFLRLCLSEKGPPTSGIGGSGVFFEVSLSKNCIVRSLL